MANKCRFGFSCQYRHGVAVATHRDVVNRNLRTRAGQPDVFFHQLIIVVGSMEIASSYQTLKPLALHHRSRQLWVTDNRDGLPHRVAVVNRRSGHGTFVPQDNKFALIADVRRAIARDIQQQIAERQITQQRP